MRNKQITVYETNEYTELKEFLKQHKIKFKVKSIPNGWHFFIDCNEEQNEEIEWLYAAHNQRSPIINVGVVPTVLLALAMLFVDYFMSII